MGDHMVEGVLFHIAIDQMRPGANGKGDHVITRMSFRAHGDGHLLTVVRIQHLLLRQGLGISAAIDPKQTM